MKQYYEKQSGGSYTVSGTVAGWYTAKHEAAYYGGNVPDDSGSDGRPRELVKEALEAAAKDPNIDLSEYDQWDRYDIDGDGVYNEPDGIIDHLMVVHAGVGEEAGGGQLGADAIWSHRWSLGDVFEIPDTESEVGQGGKLGARWITPSSLKMAQQVCSHMNSDMILVFLTSTIHSTQAEESPFLTGRLCQAEAGQVKFLVRNQQALAHMRKRCFKICMGATGFLDKPSMVKH
ncbi:hypothetical protein BsIDN1_69260 [Bacillus safensis]|uniref:Peptidase M6-like domain-containing protein n=1 Tax=Bacillus safensis TaxID=561879 RepID=A0A5S9MJM1_BACIA|nr:hypothetical protein BsIDN1_69260 [Bacillus safensis]